MNSFDCGLQVEDSQEFAQWQAYEAWLDEQAEIEYRDELNAWYDSHTVTPDEIDEMYTVSN
jgi:hypothetical protein